MDHLLLHSNLRLFKSISLLKSLRGFYFQELPMLEQSKTGLISWFFKQAENRLKNAISKSGTDYIVWSFCQQNFLDTKLFPRKCKWRKKCHKKLVQLSLFLRRHYLLFSHFYRFLHPVGTVQCVAMMKSFGFSSLVLQKQEWTKFIHFGMNLDTTQ